MTESAAHIACPKCGAAPLRGCVTKTGYGARTHKVRFAMAQIVEDCDARLSAHNAFLAESIAQVGRLANG